MPWKFISRAWTIFYTAEQHIFIVLTKRPERALQFFKDIHNPYPAMYGQWWSPNNIWLVTTAENQEQADRRIPILQQIPAIVRGISVEPCLSEIDLIGRRYLRNYLQGWTEIISSKNSPSIKYPGLDWVIVGGESGPHARPMHPEWARSLRDQCQAADVPFFFKQWGEWKYADYLPWKLGKKAAGRLLDDKEYLELPAY